MRVWTMARISSLHPGFWSTVTQLPSARWTVEGVARVKVRVEPRRVMIRKPIYTGLETGLSYEVEPVHQVIDLSLSDRIQRFLS